MENLDLKEINLQSLEKMTDKYGYANGSLVPVFTADSPKEILNLLHNITRANLRRAKWTNAQIEKFSKIATSTTERDLIDYCIEVHNPVFQEDNVIIAFQINTILDNLANESQSK